MTCALLRHVLNSLYLIIRTYDGNAHVNPPLSVVTPPVKKSKMSTRSLKGKSTSKASAKNTRKEEDQAPPTTRTTSNEPVEPTLRYMGDTISPQGPSTSKQAPDTTPIVEGVTSGANPTPDMKAALAELLGDLSNQIKSGITEALRSQTVQNNPKRTISKSSTRVKKPRLPQAVQPSTQGPAEVLQHREPDGPPVLRMAESLPEDDATQLREPMKALSNMITQLSAQLKGQMPTTCPDDAEGASDACGAEDLLMSAVESIKSGRNHPSTTLTDATFDSPLCDRVPEQIRKKIVNYEYINLDVLLPDFHDVQTFSLLAAKGKTEKVTFSSGKSLINSFPVWLDAFLTYSAVVITAIPSEALGILHHIATVQRLQKVDGDWLYYDRQFRQRRANRRTPFSEFRQTLYDEAREKNKLSSVSIPTTHVTNRFSSRIDVPKGYCYDYSNSGSCRNGVNCKFLHRCPSCRAKHPAVYCRARADTNRRDPPGHTPKGVQRRN